MQSGMDQMKAELANMKSELAQMEKQLAIAKKNNPDEAKILEVSVKALRESVYYNEAMINEMEDV